MNTIKTIKRNIYDALRDNGVGRIVSLLLSVMTLWFFVSIYIIVALWRAMVDICNLFKKKDKES